MRLAALTLAVLAVLAAAARPAIADPAAVPGSDRRDEPEDSGPSRDLRAGALAADGHLLPWMAAARHDRPGVLVSVLGGRDGSTGANVLATALRATIVDRVAIGASFANEGRDPRLRPTAGIEIDALRQPRAGLDLSVGAHLAAAGYSTVPAVIARAAAARRLGRTTLLANVELGAGLEEGERYGALGAGAVHALTRRWLVGVSSRAHLDLERDGDEPEEERDYDLQAGPVVTCALGRLALSASAGVAAWRLRLADEGRVGAVGLLGAAAFF